MKPSGRTVSAGAGSNRHSGASARLGLEKSGSRYIGLLWEKGRRANRLPKRRDGSQKEGGGAREEASIGSRRALWGRPGTSPCPSPPHPPGEGDAVGAGGLGNVIF